MPRRSVGSELQMTVQETAKALVPRTVRLPDTLAPTHGDTYRGSSPTWTQCIGGRAASEVRKAPGWYDRTSLLSSPLMRPHSERPVTSAAARRWHHTAGCCSSWDSCWRTHARVSLRIPHSAMTARDEVGWRCRCSVVDVTWPIVHTLTTAIIEIWENQLVIVTSIQSTVIGKFCFILQLWTPIVGSLDLLLVCKLDLNICQIALPVKNIPMPLTIFSTCFRGRVVNALCRHVQ